MGSAAKEKDKLARVFLLLFVSFAWLKVIVKIIWASRRAGLGYTETGLAPQG